MQQRCEHIIHTHIYVDTFESPLNLTYERPKEKVPMLMGRREVGSLSLQTDLCQIQEKLTKESEMLLEVMLGTHKMTQFCLHFYNHGQYMNLFSACVLPVPLSWHGVAHHLMSAPFTSLLIDGIPSESYRCTWMLPFNF